MNDDNYDEADSFTARRWHKLRNGVCLFASVNFRFSFPFFAHYNRYYEVHGIGIERYVSDLAMHAKEVVCKYALLLRFSWLACFGQ